MTLTSIPVSSSQHPFIFGIYLVQSRKRKQRISRIRCMTRQDKFLETYVSAETSTSKDKIRQGHQKTFVICACPRTEPKYRRRRSINHRKAVLTTHLRNRNTGCIASTAILCQGIIKAQTWPCNRHGYLGRGRLQDPVQTFRATILRCMHHLPSYHW